MHGGLCRWSQTVFFSWRKISPMQTTSRLFALVFLVILTGCFVAPIPTTKQTVSAKGKIKNFDLADVQPGVSREQIDQQLADISIDCGTPRIFWGRWSSSRWVLAYGQVVSGHGSGGDTRLSKPHNLVLEFDEVGKLLRRHDVNEEGLLPALESSIRSASLPPLNFDKPLVLNARHWEHIDDPKSDGNLVLSGKELRFQEPANSKHDFSVPASAVQSLSSGLQYETAAERIAVTIHLSAKTPAGKNVKVAMYPTELLTLIRWFQQTKKD